MGVPVRDAGPMIPGVPGRAATGGWPVRGCGGAGRTAGGRGVTGALGSSMRSRNDGGTMRPEGWCTTPVGSGIAGACCAESVAWAATVSWWADAEAAAGGSATGTSTSNSGSWACVTGVTGPCSTGAWSTSISVWDP